MVRIANVSNGLTEKMKAFCREYVANCGNGTQAYLATYNSKNEQVASNESAILLKRKDIQEELLTINKPLVNKVISEREQKRELIKLRIQACIDKEDDAGAARWMDILNKMDAEYININKNIEGTPASIIQLDTDTLKQLSS